MQPWDRVRAAVLHVVDASEKAQSLRSFASSSFTDDSACGGNAFVASAAPIQAAEAWTSISPLESAAQEIERSSISPAEFGRVSALCGTTACVPSVDFGVNVEIRSIGDAVARGRDRHSSTASAEPSQPPRPSQRSQQLAHRGPVCSTLDVFAGNGCIIGAMTVVQRISISNSSSSSGGGVLVVRASTGAAPRPVAYKQPNGTTDPQNSRVQYC